MPQKWEQWRDEYEQIAKMLQGLSKRLELGSSASLLIPDS